MEYCEDKVMGIRGFLRLKPLDYGEMKSAYARLRTQRAVLSPCARVGAPLVAKSGVGRMLTGPIPWVRL